MGGWAEGAQDERDEEVLDLGELGGKEGEGAVLFVGVGGLVGRGMGWEGRRRWVGGWVGGWVGRPAIHGWVGGWEGGWEGGWKDIRFVSSSHGEVVLSDFGRPAVHVVVKGTKDRTRDVIEGFEEGSCWLGGWVGGWVGGWERGEPPMHVIVESTKDRTRDVVECFQEGD